MGLDTSNHGATIFSSNAQARVSISSIAAVIRPPFLFKGGDLFAQLVHSDGDHANVVSIAIISITHTKQVHTPIALRPRQL
ncbi:MAG: hypothetical protein FD134_2491 [Gallionellaceae bacterium]|nr:MAG: hypothetical protein FD134_2491 [Gallionellaceae bacterium]